MNNNNDKESVRLYIILSVISGILMVLGIASQVQGRLGAPGSHPHTVPALR